MQSWIFLLLLFCSSHFLPQELSNIWQLIPVLSLAAQKAALIQRCKENPTQ